MWKVVIILSIINSLTGNVYGGDFYQSEVGNIFYFEKTQTVNWYDAIGLCHMMNMSLVSVETEAKQVEIMKLIKPLTDFGYNIWTAGQEVENYQYVWTTTGNKVYYSKWLSGEPSRQAGSAAQCIGLARTGWNNFRCAGKRYFMCEENPTVKKLKAIYEKEIDSKCQKKIMENEKKSEDILNQLIMANKSLESKAQEIEMITKFYQKEMPLVEEKQKSALQQKEVQVLEERQKCAQKEILLLEEKISLMSNCSHSPAKTYNISIAMNGHHKLMQDGK